MYKKAPLADDSNLLNKDTVIIWARQPFCIYLCCQGTGAAFPFLPPFWVKKHSKPMDIKSKWPPLIFLSSTGAVRKPGSPRASHRMNVRGVLFANPAKRSQDSPDGSRGGAFFQFLLARFAISQGFSGEDGGMARVRNVWSLRDLSGAAIRPLSLVQRESSGH